MLVFLVPTPSLIIIILLLLYHFHNKSSRVLVANNTLLYYIIDGTVACQRNDRLHGVTEFTYFIRVSRVTPLHNNK